VSSQPLKSQVEQNWRFFRQWMRAPLSTASMVPSSRHLAERMVAEVPLDAKSVIELGAGTGVFTRALLARGAPLAEVMVVELNQEMYQSLKVEFPAPRFPALQLVHGDACTLPALVTQFGSAAGALAAGKIDAVVSGLGFLNMPNKVVRSIVGGAFEVLRPGAPLIQFTYGPKSPIPESLRRELHLQVTRASFTLRNFPPASVYVITRRRER
jgi:phosphatidylethanolamine/phosphatidyl-N-methylethanolamine N-methyltransferase